MDIVLTIIAIALLPIALRVCFAILVRVIGIIGFILETILEYGIYIIFIVIGYYFYQGRDILSTPIVIMLWGILYYIANECSKIKSYK